MKPPALTRHQDPLHRYSSFANTHSFQRLYRSHRKSPGLTLFQEQEQQPVNRDQLAGVVRQGLQLPPRLYGRERCLGSNKQEIFLCRCLLEPLSDDGLLTHLLPPLPFQSGLRGLNHQLLLRQHLVRDAPLLTYRSLKSHQIHKLIYWSCG